MYEDNNENNQNTSGSNDQNTTYTNSYVNNQNTTSDSSTGSYGSGQQNTSYGSNSYSNYNYGSASGNNSYGSYDYTNAGNPGSGSSYSYNSQSGSQGYGSTGSYGNSTGSYGNNSSYTNNTSSYGNNSAYTNNASGYTNGTNSYGNYSGANYSSQSGNYQYQQPVQKKKTSGVAKKAVAIACVAAVFAGGLGVGYYGLTKNTADSASEIAQIAESTSDTASTDTTESTTDSEIKTTTTTTSSGNTVVTDVTQVVQNVMPSIVSINNTYTSTATYFGQVYSEEQTASGSGIIVGQNDTELLIVTNYHVIEGADTLEVSFYDGDTDESNNTYVEAAVKGTDSDMDLAVIAVQLDDMTTDQMSMISIATLGDSDSLTVGEPAIAIGNALGYGQSVTTGVISALNRVIELDDESTGTFIQTDAAINPGNSGGALLNTNGEVIGINSSKIGGSTIEGMGYAIPISTAIPIINELMNEETKIKVSTDEQGYIGISGVSVTSEVSQVYNMPQGVYVAQISDGGGAEAAGLQKGDIITAFNGEEISSMEDLKSKLEYYAIGSSVTLTVMRANSAGSYDEYTFEVTLQAAESTSVDDNTAGSNGEQYDGEAPADNGQSDNNQNGSGFNGFSFGG
ncbi:MAG: trypsin-like peptidase domain-containing protein [Butyrivibrio sp.]|nr:trypsin-like peptidase domain-containing protein [Butyrivibrio sp.]